MFKYLLFDLDNTLYSSRYGLEDNVRRRIREFSSGFLGISPDEAWRQRMALAGKYGTNLEWLMGEKGFTGVESYFAAVHPPNEADSLPADPELRAFLAGLPVPKAILTNSPGEHAELILSRLGIRDLFTHIFDIRQSGYKGKPRPEVFNRALNILGVKARSVLFIDDNPSYVEGFIALGGSGLLLDENGAHGDYPGARIRELKELARHIP
ncbi:MAG: HAD-IA family hydrolase [Treponema sp.]|jgi:putative hydrolase of the HAD superfamily|nr:HAD-IA family hydrolase [Treponema sp.]